MLSASQAAVCDGSRLLFIGGFHHSGTGIITHALKVRALGKTAPGVDAEIRDAWPPSNNQRIRCATEWTVWKKPTNNVYPETYNMMHNLRKMYPNMTQVFIERDLPNVAWSLAKRFKVWKMVHFAAVRDTMCNVTKAWHDFQTSKHSHPRDFTIDLADFSRAPRDFVNKVIPVPTPISAPPPPPAHPGHNHTSHSTSHLLRNVHYGANKVGKGSSASADTFTDDEYGVVPYHKWKFIKEVESAAWQANFRNPRASGHGVTDLLNVSAALATLRCGEPVLNVTSLEETEFAQITSVDPGR